MSDWIRSVRMTTVMEFLRRSAIFMKSTSTKAFKVMVKYPKVSGLLITSLLAHVGLQMRAE